MCTFNEWLWPDLSSDHSAEVGCIKENFCTDFICNLAHLSNRVVKEIKRSTDCNHRRLYFMSQFS